MNQETLEAMSVAELEQLERRISTILIRKRERALKELRAVCTHRHPDGRDAYVFKGMQWNGYEECSICSKIK